MPTDTAPRPDPPAAADDPTVVDLGAAEPTTDPTVVDATIVDPSAAAPPPPWAGDAAAPPPADGPPPPPDDPPGPGSGPGGERPPVPFARPTRRLRRTSEDAYLGGVAGGIARHVGIEPVVVRVVLGVATVASFGLVASLYAAAWLLLPDDLQEEGPGVRWYREHEHDTVALLLAAVGALLLAGVATAAWGGVWDDDGDGGWFAGLIVVAIAFLAHRRRGRGRHRSGHGPGGHLDDGDDDADPDRAAAARHHATPDPAVVARRRRHRRVRNATLLAALATGATAATLWGTGAWDVSGWVVPALVLGVLLVGLAAAPWVGWSWTLTGAVLVVLPLLVLASIPGVSLRGGVGVRVHTPQTVAELRDRYQLGVGDLEVDLTELALAPGSTTEVRVGIGVGEATVVVPDSVDVVLRGHVSGGTVLADGEDIDVRGADVDFERSLPAPAPAPPARPTASDERATPVVIVDVRAGFAQVDLRRRA